MKREKTMNEITEFFDGLTVESRVNPNLRFGDWFETYSGETFFPLDPRPEEVNITDIAYSLSHICRYNGHCNRHYSVAEHSVYVCGFCSPENRLWGLMHDAAEAYFFDAMRPIKQHIRGLHRIEFRLLEAIAQRFGLTLPIPDEVHEIDRRILVNEHRDLFEKRHEWEMDKLEPLPGLILSGEPEVDTPYNMFLNAFNRIERGKNESNSKISI